MSVQPVTTLPRPYDRVDEIRRATDGLAPGSPENVTLLGVVADQRSEIALLADEQWQEAYQLYLMGSDWQAVREAALRQAGFRCQLCGETKHLQVHHRDYLRVFHETPADLIVLCRRCHGNHHRRAF